MGRFTLSLRAEQDVDEIRSYISRDNPRAAKRVIAAIQETCNDLLENPRLGQPASTTRYPTLRVMSVNKFRHYAVFYTHADDDIFVVRIFHGARDTSSFLNQ